MESAGELVGNEEKFKLHLEVDMQRFHMLLSAVSVNVK